MKNLTLLVLVSLFVSSCASFYKPIDPHNFNYDSMEKGEDLSYAHKKDILTITGNNKYAKQEDKQNISLISVKIQNNTTNVISVKEDVKFLVNNAEVTPLDTYVVEQKIKQRNIALYALYGLMVFYVEENGERTNYPIGIPIAIGNIAVAASSNGKFRDNFAAENIMNKEIQPGETVYGMVAFRDLYSKNLTLQLR